MAPPKIAPLREGGWPRSGRGEYCGRSQNGRFSGARCAGCARRGDSRPSRHPVCGRRGALGNCPLRLWRGCRAARGGLRRRRRTDIRGGRRDVASARTGGAAAPRLPAAIRRARDKPPGRDCRAVAPGLQRPRPGRLRHLGGKPLRHPRAAHGLHARRRSPPVPPTLHQGAEPAWHGAVRICRGERSFAGLHARRHTTLGRKWRRHPISPQSACIRGRGRGGGRAATPRLQGSGGTASGQRHCHRLPFRASFPLIPGLRSRRQRAAKHDIRFQGGIAGTRFRELPSSACDIPQRYARGAD